MSKESIEICTESKDGFLKERLISARKMRDISQSELARRCGIYLHSISDFECGTREPSLTSLRKIALCLEVSVDYLMGIRDQPTGGTVRDSFTKLFSRLNHVERNVVRSLVEILITKKSLRSPLPSNLIFDSTESL